MPPIPLTPTARAILDDGNDTALLVALDAMEEGGNELLANVLRDYYYTQTKVRTSNPELTKALDQRIRELNVDYALQHRNSATTYYTKQIARNTFYSDPIGPFYFHLTTHFNEWINNPDMLSVEPIRHLLIYGCPVNEDLAMFLRNYRTQRLFSLQIEFAFTRDAGKLALILRENFRLFAAHTLTITTRTRQLNRNRLISSAVMNKVSKTCSVTIDGEKLQ